MLAAKVEDMLNTVVRQIAFVTFERRVHDERREAELTADRLGEIWLEVQRESLGPALRFDEVYRYYWTYIPHFIHTPFYVYAYAFGDCLVNSLYAVYEDAHQGFAERYLEMLRAGGTLRHRELLAPFGLDASDPAFWSKGLGVIARLHRRTGSTIGENNWRSRLAAGVENGRPAPGWIFRADRCANRRILLSYKRSSNGPRALTA